MHSWARTHALAPQVKAFSVSAFLGQMRNKRRCCASACQTSCERKPQTLYPAVPVPCSCCDGWFLRRCTTRRCCASTCWTSCKALPFQALKVTPKCCSLGRCATRRCCCASACWTSCMPRAAQSSPPTARAPRSSGPRWGCSRPRALRGAQALQGRAQTLRGQCRQWRLPLLAAAAGAAAHQHRTLRLGTLRLGTLRLGTRPARGTTVRSPQLHSARVDFFVLHCALCIALRPACWHTSPVT